MRRQAGCPDEQIGDLTLGETRDHAQFGQRYVMRAADLVICPTQPNFFDIKNLAEVAELLTRVGKLEQAVCVVNGLPYQKSGEQGFQDAKMHAEAIGMRVSPAYTVHRRSVRVTAGLAVGACERAISIEYTP